MPKIRCPGCNTRYTVSVEAGGRRTTCKKCGLAFRIPALEPAPKSDDEILRFADEFGGDAAVSEPPRPADAAPQEAIPLPSADTTVGYAQGEPQEDAATARGSYGAYFQAVVRSLAFPRDTGNLITFVIVSIVVLLATGLRLLGFMCLPWMAAFILFGWYLSFQLNVVLSAAAGEDDLPTLGLTGGVVDDIIIPFLKIAATLVLSRLPGAVFLLSVGAFQGYTALELLVGTIGFLFGSYELLLNQPQLQLQHQIAGGLLLMAGSFLWPMFVLVVAVGGIAALARVDLMVTTVRKSLPAYLVTVLIVYAAQALTFGLDLAVGWLGIGRGLASQSLSGLLLLPVALVLVEVYVQIVAMRAIGLYYHHFKQKFAWSWG